MSKLIHTPALADVTDHSDNSATFIIEPLHTGYGMTLGNSFAAYCFPALPEQQLQGFRIEGVSHEFTTVSGIKEDVVAIMLNLKGIRFKVFSEEPQTLRLAKKAKAK
jgi:DNA-directed RNA polymerase subunit alpha